MKILVTNDDGISAKGLECLVGILSRYGDITVVAPKTAQSGMSMAVSMGLKPLAVAHAFDRPGQRWWYLDGTPASCVKYGLDNIFVSDRPDLVVAGINHGSNAATAAIYSGTVGAAMEGAVNGVPSIAVSLDSFDPDADFSVVEHYLPGLLDKLIPAISHRFGTLYNINFPAVPVSEVKGVRATTMGYAHWEREYRDYLPYMAEKKHTPSEADKAYLAALLPGEEAVVMAGDFTDNGGNSPIADHLLLEQGWITVTPENIDNTDKAELDRLCDII